MEIKTTDTYAIKTSTLAGYIDELISAKRIPNWDSVLGLYIVGRPDPELRQLENAIVAERRLQHLRTVTVESLLSLAELAAEYDVAHQDIHVATMPKKAHNTGPVVQRLYKNIHLMQALLKLPSFHFGTGRISDSSKSIRFLTK